MTPLGDRCRVYVPAMGLLAALASTLLWWPQGGDQALFQLGGQQLAHGGVYWRDFWDVKQPGIFWFYAVSEHAGAGVVGVRLLEIAAALLGGALVLTVVASWRVRPVVRFLAPTLVLGPYLLACAANGVGQVEGLVTLPLLMHYWALRGAWSAPSRPTATRWAVLAGTAAAAVGVFKLLYLPLPAVIALGTWIEARSDPGHPTRLGAAAAGWLGAVLGVAAVIGGYFAAHRAFALAVYSSVQAPRDELATGLFSTTATVSMARALVIASAATAPLAVIAVVSAVRRHAAHRELVLMAWLVTAAVLAAPQLPTPYRTLILLTPLGLLAVLGLDRVLGAVDRTHAARAVVALVIVLVLAPPAPRVLRLVRTLASEPSGPGWFSDPARLAVGDRIGGSPMIGPATRMREAIPPGTAIYVLGDPVVYRVLQARQAIEINGWGPEIMSPRMWTEIVRELRRSRPEWVFVQDDYQSDVARAPALTTLLTQTYTPGRPPGAAGTWWHTPRPGHPAPSTEGNLLSAAP